ncbi:helix-turn-helix transcriptional regulator [Lichenibacterium dinghuense]|uniref:helix-turn-helix transcriptional regulator n=1 Tax=Lichenibacterium dinghuense TaxID=2895977 RepID=UPI001F485E2C|nr:helix-turn-helix domain-containing protein [Lichenibacterium sp. 6Y81]
MAIPDERGWLTPDQAAESIGIGPSTLNKMHMDGDGPEFLKIGKKVWYEPEAITRWIETRRRSQATPKMGRFRGTGRHQAA